MKSSTRVAPGRATTAASGQAAQECEHFDPETLALLGPSPVTKGEDRQRYEALLAAVAQIVKPVDIIDWALLRDFVDNQWELSRCRLAQPELIEGTRTKFGFVQLDRPNESIQSQIARAIEEELETLHALDMMVAGKEMRRTAAFRELERRRAAAKTNRRVAEQVTDAEYQVIEDEAA